MTCHHQTKEHHRGALYTTEFICSLLRDDDFALLIGATVGADIMRQFGGSTLRTDGACRHSQTGVGTAPSMHASPSGFILWYSHCVSFLQVASETRDLGDLKDRGTLVFGVRVVIMVAAASVVSTAAVVISPVV